MCCAYSYSVLNRRSWWCVFFYLEFEVCLFLCVLCLYGSNLGSASEAAQHMSWKKKCKSVCALTESTISMLAASCCKHPPQIANSTSAWFLPTSACRSTLPAAAAEAAPAPSGSSSSSRGSRTIAAPPVTPSTRPAGPNTRPKHPSSDTKHQSSTNTTSIANTSTGTTDHQHKQALAVTAKAKSWKF